MAAHHSSERTDRPTSREAGVPRNLDFHPSVVHHDVGEWLVMEVAL